MGSQWYPNDPSHQDRLGATFIPGQGDDYSMPVISPRPQRNIPEMPDNIAQNLAHLELHARPSSSLSGLQSPSPAMQSSHQFGLQASSPAHSASPYDRAPPSNRGASPRPHLVDEPTFSPFPVLKEKKLNVPPTDEEKETILQGAREAVLGSNDPEMQLAWAQDTLAFVEIASQNENRLSKTRAPRATTPTGERKLRTDAVSIVSFLADQHHPKAEFLKGTWLEFGRFGQQQDKREAYRCYQRSARNGYARSEYRMGMQFESSNEYEKAIEHYGLGIQQGDAASNYRMGMMKLLGQCGQRQDYRQGLDMLRYSADNADENAPQGAYVYGMLHAKELREVTVPEELLPLDIDTARLNIEKAAYLGFAKAQVKMGSAYELCELNCPFDPVLSLHYSNLAARQGEPEAEMAISKWFLSGYEGIFNKDEGMAFAYAQRAAADGLATAEFAMGYFHEVGIHVPTSINEARVWYSKAADHGNKDAAGRIDGISRSKTLSRKDHEKIAMAKINSTRRRGESESRTVQPPPPANVEMPAFPSAQDQYAQAPNSPPQNNYAQPPNTQYGQPHGFPPAGQPPDSGFVGYNPAQSQRPPQQTTQRPGYPQGSGPGYPQEPAFPAGPDYDPRPPQVRPPYGSPSPYEQPYAVMPAAGPLPHSGSFGRPGPSPAPQQAPGSQYQQGYGGQQRPAQGYGGPNLHQGYGGAPPPHRPGYGSPHPSQQHVPQQGGYGTPIQQQGIGRGGGGPPSNQGLQPQRKPAPAAGPPPSTSPVPNFGFTAPPDPSGADRRYHGKGGNPQASQPPSKGGYATSGGAPSARPGSARPPTNQMPSSSSSNKPPRQESLGRPQGQPTPQPKPSHGHGSALANKPAPAQNTPAPAQSKPAPAQNKPAKVPGKGPATFEEMGVPQSKKQDDCMVM